MLTSNGEGNGSNRAFYVHNLKRVSNSTIGSEGCHDYNVHTDPKVSPVFREKFGDSLVSLT